MIFRAIFAILLAFFLAAAIGIVGSTKVQYHLEGNCTVDGNVPLKDAAYSKIDFADFRCMADFQKHALASHCGDPWFDLVKYCALVQLYGNRQAEQSEIVMEESKKDWTLILIGGCVKCTASIVTELTLSISYLWPAGTFFTGCSETRNELAPIEWKSQNAITTTVNNATTANNNAIWAFTAPMVAHHRLCHGLFWDDAKPEKFEQIKLRVKHNCGGSPGSFEASLQDVRWMDNTKHVVELTDLELDLDGGKVSQFSGPQDYDKHGELQWETWAKSNN